MKLLTMKYRIRHRHEYIDMVKLKIISTRQTIYIYIYKRIKETFIKKHLTKDKLI